MIYQVVYLEHCLRALNQLQYYYFSDIHQKIHIQRSCLIQIIYSCINSTKGNNHYLQRYKTSNCLHYVKLKISNMDR